MEEGIIDLAGTDESYSSSSMSPTIIFQRRVCTHVSTKVAKEPVNRRWKGGRGRL